MIFFYSHIFSIFFYFKQKHVVKQAVERGIYIDQTQSMNIFMSVPDYKKLNSCHNWGWKNGLKTGMYYLRTQSKATALKGLGVDLNKQEKELACSIDNPENCEACGS